MQKIIWICAIALACLSGCAESIREAAPEQIAAAVEKSPMTDAKGYVWRAPELEQRHYRVTIGGYDAIYYGLMAYWQNGAQGGPVFKLWIKSNNGGRARHYKIIKLAGGGERPLLDYRHSVERCQEFSNMTNACIYWDSASAEFSRHELEQARQLGLRLMLSSGSEDYERIDVPGSYLQGFLQAVH